ncbi:glycosyltransferase family 2 protein [Acuticoccus sp. I52.16.1]|uniref:glycosyltransferase family 2 protein n=1 Tax=Acuticoccus sp. I52.16.1 TaxID=2928472 RepID=UPI001FD5651A|nr:glycosyltransferase family 2 protein [Acuticoccus sp. I52.16.1]UOM36770.1 glycosyltransferase family 2 protein [Acuticoccus sp. I52.16.1]
MRLIIQIPCYNEGQTLLETLRDLPTTIDGVDSVEILIIDDGSADATIAVAREHGVDHIIRHKKNRGLARSFRTGIDAALRLGADIIVNTDGDNQYSGASIPDLVKPIVDGRFDVIVGDRQTGLIAHFSPMKRVLQRFGSSVVRRLSDVDVPDAVSGFRAFNRNAALQFNIVSGFSYTIEMLIQAGKKHMAVGSVPVKTNPKTRESRLFKSIPKFIERSLTTMVRMYAMYQPLRFFVFTGALISFIGLLPILRFLMLYALGEGDGHIQSLTVGGALLVIGTLVLVMGVIGDLVNFNRQLAEIILEKARRAEAHQGDLIIPNADWVRINGQDCNSGCAASVGHAV